MRVSLFKLALVSFVFCFCAVLPSDVSAADWTYSTVNLDGSYPELLVDPSGRYLVANTYNDGVYKINLSYSDDEGETWNSVTVSTTNLDTGGIIGFARDQSGNYVIAFAGWKSSESRGYLKWAKSSDRGESWTSGTIDDPRPHSDARLAIDCQGAYVISYRDNTESLLMFVRSEDEGATWSSPAMISSDEITSSYEEHSIMVDSECNYLVSYYNSTTKNLIFAKSDVQGENWTYSIIDTATTYGAFNHFSTYSSLVDENDGSYLVLYEQYNPPSYNHNLLFARSTDGGATWDISQIDTDIDEAISDYGASLAIDAYGSYLVTYIFTYDSEAYMSLWFGSSDDNGQTWDLSAIEESLGDSCHGDYPSIGVDVDNDYIVASGDQAESTWDWSLRFAHLVVDLEAPVLSLTSVPSDPTNDRSPEFTGSAEDAKGTVAEVEYRIDDGAWSSCTPDDESFNSETEAFSFTPPSELADGEHTVYLRANDSLDNITDSSSYESYSFLVDATPPDFPIDSVGDTDDVEPGDTVLSTIARPAFSGVTEPLSTITIQIHSEVIEGQTIANDEGIWSWTPEVDITEGIHQVVVTVEDPAGNETSYAFTLRVELEEEPIDDPDEEPDEEDDPVGDLPKTGSPIGWSFAVSSAVLFFLPSLRRKIQL